jgi:putative hydrolase of the HAD superfamily
LKYEAVVFDLWNTLVLWPFGDGPDGYAVMAESLGVPPDRFTTAWRDAYDVRAVGPLAESVRTVCEALGVSVDRAEELVEIRRRQTQELLVPRPGALDVLGELRARGRRIGLISVCSGDVPDVWESTALAPHIDVPIFSCSVGVKKPDSRIYEIASERLGVQLSSCLFVDDQPEFVRGAVAAGMDAVLMDSPEGAPQPAGSDGWSGPRITTLSDVLELA